ncbi:hypothetical protein ACOMHN_014561 [Nucella lapillus]
MASSKKKREIRQAPKHLDKMLFINYKEEGRLQERLKDLSNSSRQRGIELDLEKVQVHNEMRLHKRRNSVPATVSPVISRPTARDTRPVTRGPTGAPPGFRRRGSASGNGDPVNEYLLTEFKRVSEVIPAILSSLNKEEKEEGEKGGGERGPGEEERRRRRRSDVMGGRGSGVNSNLITPMVRLDPDLKAFSASQGQSEDDPDIVHMVSTIRSIKTLRQDLSLKKRYDLSRAKNSFHDLLKNIHEEERRGSESDTYTDGACALLRRKMHKARRDSCPAIELTSTQGSQVPSATQPRIGTAIPKKRTPRSNTTLGSIGRQNSRDAEGMRAMLKEDDRLLTEIKVASEQRRFDDIRMRIGHFLHEVRGPSRPSSSMRRCSLPVLAESGTVREGETH